MYVFAFIWKYTCMVFICNQFHVCMYICMFVYVYMYVCIYAFAFNCIRLQCLCMYVCMYVCIRSVRPASVDLTQVVIQNDTVRRFGVSTYLNGSTYMVGEGASSIYLTIALSPDILYFLKFYAVGENYCLMQVYTTYIHTVHTCLHTIVHT